MFFFNITKKNPSRGNNIPERIHCINSPVIYSMTTSTSSSMTLCPGCTQISVTLPGFSASRLLAIFIASSTTTVSPAATSSPTLTFTSIMVPGSGALTELLAFAARLLEDDDAGAAAGAATGLTTFGFSGSYSGSISTL